MACNIALCSGLHSSSSTDRTRDTWAPKFLCIPEHSMHISIPRLSEAHTGFGMWQSHFKVTKHRSNKVKMTARDWLCNYSCTWFIARSVKIWLWSCWGNRAWFNAFSQGTNWKWVFDHSFNTFNPFISLICWVTVEYPMITCHRRHNLQNFISILLQKLLFYL